MKLVAGALALEDMARLWRSHEPVTLEAEARARLDAGAAAVRRCSLACAVRLPSAAALLWALWPDPSCGAAVQRCSVYVRRTFARDSNP